MMIFSTNRNKLLIYAIFVFAASITCAAEKIKTKKPANVVALSKSVAEMWLLSGGSLVGTTTDALDLEGIGSAVSVGTLTTTSMEAVVSLNPSLVILTKDIPLHKKLTENCRALGIRTYIVDVKNFADYERIMRNFTKETGRADLFEKNVLSVKREIVSLCADAKKRTRGTQATYLFLRTSSVKNKVLKDHFGNEIFQNLGLRSIVSDDSALDELSVEAIVLEDPDYIFVVAQGDQKRAEEAFRKAYSSHPAWKSLSAAKNGHVIMLPKELFNYKPNASWAKAYQYVRDVL